MNEHINNEQKNEELELDLSQLFLLMKKNIRLIIISVLLCITASLIMTIFFIDKKYASEERIYLTPKVTESGYVDNATVSSNNLLVNNYVSMLKGENILSMVAEELGIANVEEVKKALSISNQSNTQIISVVAKTDDPTKSKKIAETTVNIFFSEMKDKLDIKNLTIIDSPKISNTPVSPNKKLNAILGALAGGLLSCGYIFLKFLLDKRLKNRSEAEAFLGLPVLAEIPWFEE